MLSALRAGRGRSRRHALLQASVVLMLMCISACGAAGGDDSMTTKVTNVSNFAPDAGRPFGALSPFNIPIPTDIRLDPHSSAIVAQLRESHHIPGADLYDFGTPIWNATAKTPRFTVRCTVSSTPCPVSTTLVPIPTETDLTNKDGTAIIIDWSTREAYELWQAKKNASGQWTAGWGSVTDIDGMGTPGGNTPTGMSALAGVVRMYELANKWINHALVFTSASVCSSYRYPAIKSNGTGTGTTCIPAGARVQLDPHVNVDHLKGMTSAERTVAHALQVYGAYAVAGGAPGMWFQFERPSGEPNAYPRYGFGVDYFPMRSIPWQSLRVLASYNGR
jgi:hypothetical protein